MLDTLIVALVVENIPFIGCTVKRIHIIVDFFKHNIKWILDKDEYILGVVTIIMWEKGIW